MKRVIISGLSFLLLTSLLPAGGNSEATTVTQIRLSTWAGVEEAGELQSILDLLNAETGQYEIVQQSSPAEYYTKLQTTFAAGTTSELIWVDQDHLPDYAQKGALLAIGDLLKNSAKPAADISDYYQGALEAYKYKEELYGLPWVAMPVMLYVNLDMAEAAGIDITSINDWSWTDFNDAAVKMTLDQNENNPASQDFDATAIKQYGFSVVPGWPPVQIWIWGEGGEVLTHDLKTSPLDSPSAIAGAQLLANLIHKARTTPQQSVIGDRGFGDMMKNGQVAMFMGGSADDFEKTPDRRIKAFMMPMGSKKRVTWAWIGGMSIFSGAKQDAALLNAFLDLSEAIHHWKAPAPRISLATREGIIKSVPYKEVSADNILASMPFMQTPHIFPGYTHWSTVFAERFVDPLVRGNSDAKTLAQTVRPLLEDILKEYQ